MNENRAVFCKYQGKYVLMHINGNRAEHIYAYESLDKIYIGTIINCRAEEHADGINATFVRYSRDETGFINKFIKGKSVVPLMYKKDSHEDKKACFTDKLSISGDYAVVIPGEPFVKISSKIDLDKRELYRQHFIDISRDIKAGIIIRTKTDTLKDGIEAAEQEIEKICAILESIKKRSEHTPAYTILYSPVPDYINDLIYLCDQGIEEIVTDDPEIKEAVEKAYYNAAGVSVNVTDRVGLRFYTDELLPLCNLYAFKAKISEALLRKVHLKSGAYITFDRTEALTAVDVNSSSSSYKGDKEESFLRINTEAAEEICRQLRLRNLSGMIVIDFINMDDQNDFDVL